MRKLSLDDYSFAAISLEGSKNWPFYWKGDEDPFYKEYMRDLKTNKKIDAKDYIDKAIAHFKSTNSYMRPTLTPRTKVTFSKRRRHGELRRTKRRFRSKSRRFKKFRYN